MKLFSSKQYVLFLQFGLIIRLFSSWMIIHLGTESCIGSIIKEKESFASPCLQELQDLVRFISCLSSSSACGFGNLITISRVFTTSNIMGLRLWLDLMQSRTTLIVHSNLAGLKESLSLYQLVFQGVFT
jgi:hypothetical protein